MTRFEVHTVTGHTYSSGRSKSAPGVSAHVCDTVYLHEVVATYRSTDAHGPGHGKGARLGVDGALAAAEAHAARLNDGR